MNLLSISYLFITDIGSTTTKGLLLKKENNQFIFFHQADASTTVEKPHEDVNIGVLQVVKKLEELSGVQIYKDNNFLIPYITTSSAAGGLQIMVVGLTKRDTAKNAELTALGAGGVILRTFSVNDGLRDIEKINIMNNLDPDMVLFAGGYDNKTSFYNIFSLSNLLSLADIKSRFEQENKIPLLYCGNNYAKDYVQSFLEEKLDITVTENIRPSIDVYNYTPAKQKISEIFKNDVMKRAPGFKTLSSRVSSAVAVTPTAVERMIEIYSQNNKENIIVVDMGGATTDIYSYIKGKYHRTVAANIGLSFSLGNIFATILESESLEYIMNYMPKGLNYNFVKNYIYNKTVTPSYIPLTKAEKLIEKVIAAIGINLAMKQHLETNFDNKTFELNTNFVKDLKSTVVKIGNILTGKSNSQNFYKFIDNEGFYYSDIDKIIGSGGAISFADNKFEQIQLLIEGFMPSGITVIAVDSPFKISHMGLFSYFDKENALKLFEDDCVEDLALVVAPNGKMKENKIALNCTNLDTNENFSLKGGTVTYFENGGNFHIKSNLRIDKNKNEADIHTKLPIIFDLRGREKYFNGVSLEKSGCKIFETSILKEETKIINITPNYNHGIFEFKRQLPHKGIIRVKKGEKVEVDKVFGETKFRLPKYYFIDLKRFLLKAENFKNENLKDGLLVKVGDSIKENQPIYKRYIEKEIDMDVSLKSKTTLESNIFKSPIDGVIENIDLKNGMIKVVEELFSEDKFVEVKLAEALKVKPKRINSYLSYKLNDMVLKKQIIGKRIQIGVASKFYRCKSPISGIIKKIDTVKGTVLIVNESIKDIYFKTNFFGEITDVKPQSIKITARGIKFMGIMGYGTQSYGILDKFINLSDIKNDRILYLEKTPDYETLQKLLKLSLNGLILPSVDAENISKIIGKEIGVAITGDEHLKFPIIILHGFGNINMSNQTKDIFEKYKGEMISISGRTHVRAGILRSFIMFYDRLD